jgi:hypothetical protein
MSKRVLWLDGAGLEDSLKPCTGRHMPISEHSLKTNTTPLIEPSSKSNSTTLPKHKNALSSGTNSKQEQQIDIDPNTILRNSLINTNYYFDPQKIKYSVILHQKGVIIIINRSILYRALGRYQLADRRKAR